LPAGNQIQEFGMVPLPKRKLSKGRRDRRRAHDALMAMNLVQCSQCGEMRLPHTVCPNCGHYQGREVISTEKEKKTK
jgi:large subunit ribosomal protein L32